MDISKETILMNKKAIELQNIWFPKEGDWIIDTVTFPNEETLYMIGGNPTFDDDIRGMQNNFNQIKKRSFCIFRQDQLQELCIYFSGVMNIPSLQRFMDFVSVQLHDNYSKFTSMEQLWLAYYMMSKHFKVWNGTDWEITR